MSEATVGKMDIASVLEGMTAVRVQRRAWGNKAKADNRIVLDKGNKTKLEELRKKKAEASGLATIQSPLTEQEQELLTKLEAAEIDAKRRVLYGKLKKKRDAGDTLNPEELEQLRSLESVAPADLTRFQKDSLAGLRSRITPAEAEELSELEEELLRYTASKKLIICPELERLEQYLTKEKNWVLERSRPFSILGRRSGIYLVRNEVDDGDKVVSVVSQIAKRIELCDRMIQLQLIPDLEKAWPAAKERAKTILSRRGEFNERDFPAVERLKNLYSLRFWFIELAVPRDLPPEIRAKEEEKFKAAAEKEREEMVWSLREMFQAVTDRLTENLKSLSDGDGKKFYDSNVTNLMEFIDTFPFKNLIRDDRLKGLVDQAKGMLEGVAPKDLRSNEASRERTLEKVEAIKDSVDALMAERPERAFDVDDD